MAAPRIAIIIVNWNGWRDTIECLESLKAVTYGGLSVYVVDNGSTDDSVAQLETYQSRRKVGIPTSLNQNHEASGLSTINYKLIRNSKNLGFAGGNNIGIKKALADGAEYVLLLNNDTVVSPDFLSRLVEAVESDSHIGIIGPKIYFASKTETGSFASAQDKFSAAQKIWFGGGKLNRLKTRGTHVDYGKKDNAPQPPLKLRGGEGELCDTGYITGCCLLAKRAVIEKIGLLSEDYFLYYEDVDWCLRAKNAGFRIVYVPDAHIWHKVSRSAEAGSSSYIYYHVRNGLMLAWRHGTFFSRLALPFFILWTLAKQIIKLALPQKRLWAIATLRGIQDFLCNRKGAKRGK